MCSIGNTWLKIGMHLNGVLCGLMAMLCNLKAQSFGILSVSILPSVKVVKWVGVALEGAFARVPVMGQGLW